jgi:hypothetical protein
MAGWAAIFILLGLLTFSANERSRRLRKVNRNTGTETPIKSSPMSDAITHTVGIAGGIYIAIVTTTSFLRISVPETFDIMGISIDPVAGIAFIVTILYPFVLTLRDNLLE